MVKGLRIAFIYLLYAPVLPGLCLCPWAAYGWQYKYLAFLARKSYNYERFNNSKECCHAA